jgi:hypothetical protein
MHFRGSKRSTLKFAAPVVLGLLFVLPGLARAETPEEALYRDLWQTVRARKLLLEDPLLAPLNVGVKVTNRVAVLWGPIPSTQLALRAEQRLRIMFELAEVRNRLTVEPTDDVAPAGSPDMPRFLPDDLPPADSPAPRLAPNPKTGVALAGIVMPDETIVARSSPLIAVPQAGAAIWHLPFLGGIPLPR